MHVDAYRGTRRPMVENMDGIENSATFHNTGRFKNFGLFQNTGRFENVRAEGHDDMPERFKNTGSFENMGGFENTEFNDRRPSSETAKKGLFLNSGCFENDGEFGNVVLSEYGDDDSSSDEKDEKRRGLLDYGARFKNTYTFQNSILFSNTGLFKNKKPNGHDSDDDDITNDPTDFETGCGDFTNTGCFENIGQFDNTGFFENMDYNNIAPPAAPPAAAAGSGSGHEPAVPQNHIAPNVMHVSTLSTLVLRGSNVGDSDGEVEDNEMGQEEIVRSKRKRGGKKK